MRTLSFYNARLIHEPDWGLPDESISMIIASEKMQEITERFQGIIKPLCEKFGNVSKIRIASFNENSGADPRSIGIFKAFINSERDVMYVGDMSNRECCVVFLNAPSGIAKIVSMPEILAHEYAHHYQFANAGFPCYFTKSMQYITGAPSFAKPCEMGETMGTALLDGVQLPDYETVIDDALERVSDVICEGILREKRIPSALEKLYAEDLSRPAPDLPRRGEILNRYLKRLTLRDYSEWGAVIKLSVPEAASTLVSKGREKAHELNKNHMNAYKAFDEVFKLCLETDFNQFKNPLPTKAYMQKVFDILRIRLKPELS